MSEPTQLAPTPEVINRTRGQVVVCPPGWSVNNASDCYDVRARAAIVHCFTPDALAEFIRDRAKSRDNMRVYVDNRNRKITAIFDDADEGYEALRRDRAMHTAEPSEEYNQWKQNDRAWRTKYDFLVFLEDHEGDIASPNTAQLRTLINELRLKKKVTWENTEKQTGAADVTLEYKTESEQAGEIKVPEMIVINIPIFRDGAKYAIECRLRFDLDEGKLQLQYCLPGTQHIIDQAWTDSLLAFTEKAAMWKVYAAVAPDEQKV